MIKSLFKFIGNADPYRYSYRGYGTGFDSCSFADLIFLFPDFERDKNAVIFWVLNASVNIDNEKKDILVLDEVLTQGLDNNMIIAKAKYSINFSKLQSKFCLSHPYNGSNIFFC